MDFLPLNFYFTVTANQIERLYSRFTSLDKQQKGYLTRDDFLRIPELAINPLCDRIVHAFFRDGHDGVNGISDISSEKGLAAGAAAGRDVVNFCDFVRVLAHFRPLKKTMEKNKLNSRDEKLKCKCFIGRLTFSFTLFYCLPSCFSNVRPGRG